MEIIKFFTNDLGFNPNYDINYEYDDWSTIELATLFGHLDVVKFLVNADTPRNNYDFVLEKAGGGYPDVVDFLKAQRRQRRPPIRYQDHQMSTYRKKIKK